MLLGNLLFGDKLPGATTFPLVLGAISIVASIVGSWVVGLGKVSKTRIMASLYNGMIVAGVLALIGFVIAGAMTREFRGRHLFLVALGVWLLGFSSVMLLGITVMQWLASALAIFFASEMPPHQATSSIATLVACRSKSSRNAERVPRVSLAVTRTFVRRR